VKSLAREKKVLEKRKQKFQGGSKMKSKVKSNLIILTCIKGIEGRKSEY
jgi:hypothetical protein